MNAIPTPFVPSEVEASVHPERSRGGEVETPAPACTCPGCGQPFAPGGRGQGKRYCSDPCRRAFHAATVADGQPLAPLVQAWIKTRHAKPGSREAEICRYARQQITEIAGIQIERHEDAGRDPVAFVAALMDSGTRYIDRTRK